MIWGKTTKEKLDRYYGAKIWFSWYPVQLNDGRWIWWEKVIRQEVPHRDGSDTEYFLLLTDNNLEQLESKCDEKSNKES